RARKQFGKAWCTFGKGWLARDRMVDRARQRTRPGAQLDGTGRAGHQAFAQGWFRAEPDQTRSERGPGRHGANRFPAQCSARQSAVSARRGRCREFDVKCSTNRVTTLNGNTALPERASSLRAAPEEVSPPHAKFTARAHSIARAPAPPGWSVVVPTRPPGA